MSLSTILKEMAVNRPNAEMNVDLGSPNTLGGRKGLKRAGVEALKRLNSQYRRELLKTAAFIVVTGGAKDSFSDLASSEAFGCFTLDPDAFYRDLVSGMDPKLFGREGIKGLFGIVGNRLRDRALDLDIKSYPMLRFSDKYNSAVNKAEDLVPLIRSAINDQVGSEIVGISAVYSITEEAVKRGHEGVITPIVLNTTDARFALDLQTNLKRLTPKTFLVVAGKASKELNGAKDAIVVKTVSEENVGEALSKIRNNVL